MRGLEWFSLTGAGTTPGLFARTLECGFLRRFCGAPSFQLSLVCLSDGTKVHPLTSTTDLDAHALLAILHFGSEHCEVIFRRARQKAK
jgi:hypothetical protein